LIGKRAWIVKAVSEREKIRDAGEKKDAAIICISGKKRPIKRSKTVSALRGDPSEKNVEGRR